METKLSRRSMVLGMGAGTTVAGLASPAIAQQKTVLRMQTIDPPAFIGPSVVLPRTKKMIEELSGGSMSIEVYTGGQVVPTAEIPKALAAGVIDLAYTAPIYYTGSVPECSLTLTGLPPMLFPSPADAIEVYWHQGIDDIIAKAFRPEGVEFLGGVFIGDPITFWSKEPLSSVDELKGFKVRSFGLAAKTFENLGATPVFLPHEEVYTALAQGTIDGSMTNAGYYKQSKYFEVAPYIYEPAWFPASHMCAMGSSLTWSDLSEEQRSILHYAMRHFSNELQHFSWLSYMRMRSELQDMGSTLISWSDDDAQAIQSAGASFMSEIRAEGETVSRGAATIQEYIESIYG